LLPVVAVVAGITVLVVAVGDCFRDLLALRRVLLIL
jgi:hypothetical protein